MSYVMSYFIELNTWPTQLLKELLLDVSNNASCTDFFFSILLAELTCPEFLCCNNYPWISSEQVNIGSYGFCLQ